MNVKFLSGRSGNCQFKLVVGAPIDGNGRENTATTQTLIHVDKKIIQTVSLRAARMRIEIKEEMSESRSLYISKIHPCECRLWPNLNHKRIADQFLVVDPVWRSIRA